MYKETGKIAANMSLIQVSEVDNSNQLEKKEFIKTLQITTDRHTQIRKHMREKEQGINQQFDV